MLARFFISYVHEHLGEVIQAAYLSTPLFYLQKRVAK